MNLAEIYARHAQEGLEALAEKAGVTVPYLQRMLFVLNRRPRTDKAADLVRASRELWGERGALTIEGLADPVYYETAIKEALRKGVAHPKWMLLKRESVSTGKAAVGLADIYAIHGPLGIEKLADVAEIDREYVRRLLYLTKRRPSVDRASALIKASEKIWGKKNGLTIEGLTNPRNFKDVIDEAIEQGIAHPTWIIRRAKSAERAAAKKEKALKTARAAKAAQTMKPKPTPAKRAPARRVAV
jgi:hypothetical protein